MIKVILSVGLIVCLTLVAFLVIDKEDQDQEQIQITRKFIENDFWDDKYNNRIQIDRMKIVDTPVELSAIQKMSFPDFENILKEDPAFSASYWGINSSDKTQPQLEGKVYFDRNNGWEWNFNGSPKSTIGELEKNTWYKFSNLRMNTKYYKYVYVDGKGKTHIFNVNKANF